MIDFSEGRDRQYLVVPRCSRCPWCRQQGLYAKANIHLCMNSEWRGQKKKKRSDQHTDHAAMPPQYFNDLGGTLGLPIPLCLLETNMVRCIQRRTLVRDDLDTVPSQRIDNNGHSFKGAYLAQPFLTLCVTTCWPFFLFVCSQL